MKLQRQRLWLLCLLVAGTFSLHAQVTIGSEQEPNKGALLDLKMEDITTKGLALPRVELKDPKALTMGDNVIADGPTQSGASTVWKDHTGLVVFNIGGNALCGIPTGLYVWDGGEWTPLWQAQSGDVAALKELRDANPGNTLNWTGDDPSAWPGVTWGEDACGVQRVTRLSINSKNLTSSAGIGKLYALEILDCSVNFLTALDVSNNTELTQLLCERNQLPTLDVSNNTKLRTLSCANNSLTALDVSNNTELTALACSVNSLTTLDISNNTKLRALTCETNFLTALDISKNTELTNLRCFDNQLTALDISNNTKLGMFICKDNIMPQASLDAIRNAASANGLCSDYNSRYSLIPQNGYTVTKPSCP